MFCSQSATVPTHARSALALCSRCFDKINWHRIGSSARSAGSAGRSASGRHAPRLLRSARHVTGGRGCGVAAPVTWLVLPAAAEDRLPRPSVRVAEREFWRADVRLFRKVGCLRLSHSRRVALFLGRLGSALFRTTRRGALSSCPPDSRAWRPRPTAPAEMALLQPGLITEGGSAKSYDAPRIVTGA